MIYSSGLGSEDLNTFSICLRFNVEFLRPEFTEILSYSTYIHDNSLSSWLWFQTDNKLIFQFCKYYNYNRFSICSQFIMKSLKIHDHWHHACWLFNTNQIDSDPIKVSTKLFFNGKEVDQGALI